MFLDTSKDVKYTPSNMIFFTFGIIEVRALPLVATILLTVLFLFPKRVDPWL